MKTDGHAGPAQGWVWAKLEDLVDILDSLRVPVNANERANRIGDVPYFGATGQVGWIDDHLFDEELVLLGEDGAPFLDPYKPTAYIIRGKSWVNNHAHVLRALGGIPSPYVKYALNQTEFHQYVSGTTRLKLPQAPMRQIRIPVAPLREQRRIVAEIEKHFTRLDAAVAALKRARANLKRYRASVLKAACGGGLVPTEAELARAQGRDYEPADVLLERILRERREHWEADQLTRMQTSGKPLKDDRWKANYTKPPDASGLPDLPEGWAWATLASVAELKGGITKGQKRKPREALRAVPYLRVANVQRGFLDLSEMKMIEATEDEILELGLEQGDVLFTEGGDRDKLGRGWVWQGELTECIHQNHIFRARLLSRDLQPKFVSWYGNSFGQAYFVAEGKQTTNLASINLTKLKAFPVPIPPSQEQRRIVADVERRLSVVDELERLIERGLKRAERLRQSILKSAFEGKLVLQDPNDEPASVLLERIRTERVANAGKSSSRGRRSPRGTSRIAASRRRR